jgi:hypothetical protein
LFKSAHRHQPSPAEAAGFGWRASPAAREGGLRLASHLVAKAARRSFSEGGLQNIPAVVQRSERLNVDQVTHVRFVPQGPTLQLSDCPISQGGVAQRQSGGLQNRVSAGSIPASPANLWTFTVFPASGTPIQIIEN